MGTVTDRIAALRAANPNHDAAHPLRLRVSDTEVLELVKEIFPEGLDENAPHPNIPFQRLHLNEVGAKANGDPKPTLMEAAEALEEFMEKPAPGTTATHAQLREWVERKTALLQDVWEHLEGITVADVELIQER